MEKLEQLLNSVSQLSYPQLGFLAIFTLIIAKVLAGAICSRRRGRLPPQVRSGVPVIGGLMKFLSGPIPMIREEFAKQGSVFTVNLLTKNVTFFIGPEVSQHFFKAPESELSQQEVYRFNVPTFGPGVVFDVDYSVRQEQFRFFTESLRVNRLKSYVDHMVYEAEILHFGKNPRFCVAFIDVALETAICS